MKTRSKSTLFLVEQLIVIAVFALCAIACISILATSYLMVTQSRDTSNAMIAAQNYAEAFKAAHGDIEATLGMLGGWNDYTSLSSSGDDFSIQAYYDSDWQQVSRPQDAEFMLIFSGRNSLEHSAAALYSGEITVQKIDGGTLVSIPIAVRK